MQNSELPVLTFASAAGLWDWLNENHAKSRRIWIRICRKNCGIQSVTFEEVLDAGLCFGWSESMRRRGDETSYLQRFTPRRTKGTASERNRQHVRLLIREGKIMPSGLHALRYEDKTGDI